MKELNINNICVRGDKDRGKDIIDAFAKLGVRNEYQFECSHNTFCYYSIGSSLDLSNDSTPNKTEITIDQLIEMADNMNNNNKDFIITKDQAQSIIDIACLKWKNTLANMWASDIVLNKGISISSEFYKSMRLECTTAQHEFFDTIFGKDEKTKTYSIGDRFKYKYGGEYLLTYIGDSKVQLTNLKTGAQWESTTKVENIRSITEEELTKIMGAFRGEFTQIEK